MDMNSIQISDPTLQIVQPMKPSHFVFEGKNGEITIDLETGKVTYSSGLTLDQASKLFWTAVKENFPYACQSKK